MSTDSVGSKENYPYTGSELVDRFGPHIKDKVVLVTGPTLGSLGGNYVLALAAAAAQHAPRLLVLAGRDPSKLSELATEARKRGPVQTRVLQLDLGSFASVRKAAAEVLDYEEDVDVLVNNAGVMALPYGKTEDGFERQFQVNHLGHFLFTGLILPKLLGSKEGGRVVNVSSDGYRLCNIRYDDYGFHDGESYDPWYAYGQAKTANILFARGLAARYGAQGLQAYSLHPAHFMGSHLGDHGPDFDALAALDKKRGAPNGWGGFDFCTPDQAIGTHMMASFSPDLKGKSISLSRPGSRECVEAADRRIEQNGAYMEHAAPVPEDTMYPWAVGPIETRKLWELSEKLVGQSFGAA